MEKYIDIIKEDQHLNAEILKIIHMNTMKIQKLLQIRILRNQYHSNRSLSQIEYYIQTLKSSIYKTMIKLSLFFWLVFIILFTSYRILEVIHTFIN